MTNKPKITDEEYSSKWQELLGKFKKLIEKWPPPEKIKTELSELVTLAINAAHLTPRQKDGIITRCNNYMNGEYGNTKTKENIEYGVSDKAQLNGQPK